ERVLPHIGRPRVETRGAIGEIETPAADEPFLEALRADRGRACVARREPAFQRLGIVATECMHAGKHESRGLRDVDEARRRGEHAAGKDVLLDEIRLRAVTLEAVVGNCDGLYARASARPQRILDHTETRWP